MGDIARKRATAQPRCPKCGEVLGVIESDAGLVCKSCGLALFELVEMAGNFASRLVETARNCEVLVEVLGDFAKALKGLHKSTAQEKRESKQGAWQT